jgi:2-methylisocitrate lyase-like PEP mutase family enzyme
MNMDQSEHVERFRALHAEGRMLVLPNAWDVLSARLVEEAGAEAVATTSAALAWARGRRDGEELPQGELVDAVQAIARCARVPLTVDFERGYHVEPERVADAVARLAAIGVAGVNLEDSAESADQHARKIEAVRRRVGANMFVNARTCLVLRGKVTAERAIDELLARARIYADAGADGLFVPGLVDARAIEAIAHGTPLPLNLMLMPGLPPLAELRRLGVRRLSVGPRLAEVAYAAARRAARDLLERDDTTALLGADLTYPEANALLPRS